MENNNNNRQFSALIVLIVLLYVISPVDLLPGLLDDLLLIFFSLNTLPRR